MNSPVLGFGVVTGGDEDGVALCDGEGDEVGCVWFDVCLWVVRSQYEVKNGGGREKREERQNGMA